MSAKYVRRGGKAVTDPRAEIDRQAAAALAEALTTAIVDIEEERLPVECFSDECSHADGEHPEPGVHCGDGQRLAAAILAALPADWCGHGEYEAEMERLWALDRAEIARLREALDAIAEPRPDNPNWSDSDEMDRAVRIARAALEEKP